jgi:cytochrome b subunit of formate dehydrogenase
MAGVDVGSFTRGVALLALSGALGALWSQTAPEKNEVCAGCHEAAPTLAASAHAGVECLSCHPKHEEYPHPASEKTECAKCHLDATSAFKLSVHGQEQAKGNAAAPDCAMCHAAAHEVKPTGTVDFRKQSLETCGMCHAEVGTDFAASVHGKLVQAGSAEAPVCTDCHGEHQILRPTDVGSQVHPLRVRDTCANCHTRLGLAAGFRPQLNRVTSFDDTFHGLALRAGNPTVANCASCHGVHNILPASDPASQIHPKNLAHTCGGCHPGAGERFALGPVHLTADQAASKPVEWVRQLYLVLIPVVLGLMILHNAGDFIRKLWKLRLGPERNALLVRFPGNEIRMYPAERLQHALLAISFIVLTWTGFALLYPDAWWARPLLYWEDRISMRGWVHRGAAVMFMITGLLHVVLTFRSRRLRHHWTELIPRASDVREAGSNLTYNLGLRSERPVLSSHSYIEKAEYWAVVWGFAIMVLSGLILWANNWTLRYFPKVVLDVATAIHFYEAILAAAAIVIWHFYFVLFDPDVYPMDSAWLTGVSVRRRKRAEQNVADADAQPSETLGD